MSELRERIRQTIDSEDVVLFMKGRPERVMCGNSSRALDALRSVGAPVTTVDVLPDPAIRTELSALSSWPTIPQVFVRGELLGGADIVQELAETGELREKLESSLPGRLGRRPRGARRRARAAAVASPGAVTFLDRLLGRKEPTAAKQEGDAHALDRDDDPRGGVQSEAYRLADPRDVVEEGGKVMSGPGGAPQEETTPAERREQHPPQA